MIGLGAVGCLVVAVAVAGFGALTVSLAMDVKERGPTVPPLLEASYRQVAHDRQVDWALLAAWDGAEFGFVLPVRTQQEIYYELYERELATKREVARRWCELHPGDPAFCPPPEPSLTPEERELLGQVAYRAWRQLVLVHISRHADTIMADLETFQRAPEEGYRKVLSGEMPGRAVDLYEGYLLLAQLDQDDDHVIGWEGPDPPVDGQPVDGFAWPVVGPITSRYGMRVSPIDGKRRLHAGIDLGVASGTAVRASKGGIVTRAEMDSTYGLVVVVDHGGGYETLYAHNSHLAVRVGSQVRQGQVVAESGSTGLSTGPHVHFEIHQQGAPVDPLLFLGR